MVRGPIGSSHWSERIAKYCRPPYHIVFAFALASRNGCTGASESVNQLSLTRYRDSILCAFDLDGYLSLNGWLGFVPRMMQCSLKLIKVIPKNVHSQYAVVCACVIDN